MADHGFPLRVSLIFGGFVGAGHAAARSLQYELQFISPVLSLTEHIGMLHAHDWDHPTSTITLNS
jgi:hypothetical protein